MIDFRFAKVDVRPFTFGQVLSIRTVETQVTDTKSGKSLGVSRQDVTRTFEAADVPAELPPGTVLARAGMDVWGNPAWCEFFRPMAPAAAAPAAPAAAEETTTPPPRRKLGGSSA